MREQSPDYFCSHIFLQESLTNKWIMTADVDQRAETLQIQTNIEFFE